LESRTPAVLATCLFVNLSDQTFRFGREFTKKLFPLNLADVFRGVLGQNSIRPEFLKALMVKRRSRLPERSYFICLCDSTFQLLPYATAVQISVERQGPSYLAPISSQAAIQRLAVATTSDHGAQLAVMVLNEDQSNGPSFSSRMNSDPVQGPGDIQINIPAGVARKYFDTIPAESTFVLVFNAQGQLTTKVT
jgi:hypothetical protein